MIILGAGLAGCLAACLTPNTDVFEVQSKDDCLNAHRAVLRFREDKISRALGIPFKKVRVHKSIWYDGNCYSGGCCPHFANWYSQKVIGRIEDRSIWNLDTVERWVAPDDLHEQMVERIEDRITWDTAIVGITPDHILFDEGNERGQITRWSNKIISTLPMPVMHRITGTGYLTDDFKHQQIKVYRYQLKDCDVHQTIYFPNPQQTVYRATLTGSDLIVEAMSEMDEGEFKYDVLPAFGLGMDDLTSFHVIADQKFGKIKEMPAEERKKRLLDFTVRFNVWSLGRFACWRNILLDDCYEDLFKIRSMIGLGHYDLIKAVS